MYSINVSPRDISGIFHNTVATGVMVGGNRAEPAHDQKEINVIVNVLTFNG